MNTVGSRLLVSSCIHEIRTLIELPTLITALQWDEQTIFFIFFWDGRDWSTEAPWQLFNDDPCRPRRLGWWPATSNCAGAAIHVVSALSVRSRNTSWFARPAWCNNSLGAWLDVVPVFGSMLASNTLKRIKQCTNKDAFVDANFDPIYLCRGMGLADPLPILDSLQTCPHIRTLDLGKVSFEICTDILLLSSP